jgi:hypothetical protein
VFVSSDGFQPFRAGHIALYENRPCVASMSAVVSQDKANDSSPFQLRVVSSASASVWWKVLCRGNETVRTVRERLANGPGVKDSARLYHNGAALDENATLEDLAIDVDTIVSTGRTQSVVFGLASRERIVSEAVLTESEATLCCDRALPPKPVTRKPKAAPKSTVVKGVTFRAPHAISLASGSVASSRPRSPISSADVVRGAVADMKVQHGAITGFLASRQMAAATSAGHRSSVASVPPKATQMPRQVAATTLSPAAELHPRYRERRLKTPTVPLDMDLFVVVPPTTAL